MNNAYINGYLEGYMQKAAAANILADIGANQGMLAAELGSPSAEANIKADGAVKKSPVGLLSTLKGLLPGGVGQKAPSQKEIQSRIKQLQERRKALAAEQAAAQHRALYKQYSGF